MKNKKSLRNLKQYRNKVRFAFYVKFRPVAQKLFFPICFLIFSIACANHWYDNRGTWVFENAEAAVFDETNLIETAQSVSGGLEVSGTMAQTPASTVGTVGGNQSPSVSGSAVEVSILDLIHKYFPEEKEVAVAVFKGESGLNPAKESDTDRMADGRAFSAGIAQINLTVSEVGGVNCTKAFSGQSYKAKVIDEALYQKCLELSKNPVIALEAARKKYEGRKNTFNAWSVFTKGHYEKYL